MPGHLDPEQLPPAVTQDQKGEQAVKIQGRHDARVDSCEC
jgi:hypothetical protein